MYASCYRVSIQFEHCEFTSQWLREDEAFYLCNDIAELRLPRCTFLAVKPYIKLARERVYIFAAIPVACLRLVISSRLPCAPHHIQLVVMVRIIHLIRSVYSNIWPSSRVF